MSIIGNCTKTGAVVKFIEYGQTFVADLFKVGDAIVVRFTPGSFDQVSSLTLDERRPVTHEVYIGSYGLLDKRGGIAVALEIHLKEV